MKNKMALCWRLASVLGVFLAVAPAAFAAITVEVLDTVKINESHAYGYFPSLQMLSTGELICDFSMDADTNHIEDSFWAYVISRDKGKTWGMRNTAGFIYREAAYTRDPALGDGSMLVVAGYPLPGPNHDYRNLRSTSWRVSDGGDTALFKRDVAIHLPQPTQRVQMEDKIINVASPGRGKIKEAALMLFNGTMVRARDGGWLTLMYGKLEGDEYFRSIVVKAGADGRNWDYVSTIAGDAAAKEALAAEKETKTEGFGEPRMIRLKDGRLFAVMRRGSDNMIYKSWSGDEGRTWTQPVSIGFRGVEPAMMELKDGLLALCTGRPEGIAVRFSADGGASWGNTTPLTKGFDHPKPEKPHGAQKSTCYTGMVEVEPGRLLIVYDHLPYVDGWGLNPESEPKAMNTIYGTFVKITR